MAYFFADTFDCYAAPADAIAGYWDSGNVAFTLGTGRFSGSRAMVATSTASVTAAVVQKASGSNDSVHHISFGISQSAALTGTSNYWWFTFMDGATAQCSVVVRSDGAILLVSGATGGTTLATYTGALTATATWYQFEVEVVINNTTGSISIRKNGNTSNDFTLGSLNTRGGTANNYANTLKIGNGQAANSQSIDDLIWRSDASSVPWIGDVRGWARMPVSDASVQWTPSAAILPHAPYAQGTTLSFAANRAYFAPFTAPCTGTIGTVTIPITTAATANLKCAIYQSAAGLPTIAIGSTPTVANPGIGTTTFTFSTPPSITQGTQYFVAVDTDATSGAFGAMSGGPGTFYTITYASFPTSNPTSSTATNSMAATINITPTTAVNAPFVAETQQDAANSYVYSSTVGQSDRYGIAPISSTPSSVVAVVTRAYAQKSDAGTRNIAVQLQSGAANVQSASTALNTTWGWLSRTDLTDPATGAAWTAVGVNNAQVGVVVTA